MIKSEPAPPAAIAIIIISLFLSLLDLGIQTSSMYPSNFLAFSANYKPLSAYSTKVEGATNEKSKLMSVLKKRLKPAKAAVTILSATPLS